MRSFNAALALLLSSTVASPLFAQAPAAQPAQATVKPSKNAHKPILDLQTAVTAGDQAAIAEKLSAAKAVASTKEDRYLIAQLQLKSALARKDYGNASSAIGDMRSSGYLPDARIGELYRAVGVEAYNAKQFDQASTMLETASSIDPQNLESTTLLAEARVAQGRKQEGLALLQNAIKARVAAGQKPQEVVYKRAVQLAYDARLPAAADLSRDWLAAYPSKDSWRNSVAIYRNLHKPDTEGTLALMRLLRAAGALNAASDMAIYVSALSDQYNYIEAQTALDQAIAANAGDAQLKNLAASLQSKDRPTAADLAQAAKSASSGNALLRVGDRYYGLGEYAKAAEIYRQVAAKGVDGNVANLHLGMALAAAGDKAGATTAFNAVTGAHAGAAKYWLLYLQGRS